MKFLKQGCLLLLLAAFLGAGAQNSYRYTVNLNNLQGDSFHVQLSVPKLKGPLAVFSFPKIIPGTYSISDYGKFVSNVKAFDAAGKPVSVTKLNENQWKIANASRVSQITYVVDDIFDAAQKHGIYPMAATNIEAGKNVVLHAPAVFGFFEGMTQLPVEVQIEHPQPLYGSTSLKPVTATATKDVFQVPNVDQLYDAPIMYTVPDTTTIRVGNADVLISVYSPNKLIQSKQIATWLNDLMEATRQYLGGKLPTDRYAFLYYFKDPQAQHSFPPGLMGALEHATSSFYYLPDAPAETLKPFVVDVSSHEFFHIITPLTIASREVKEFNYTTPVLSQHLWLYEGVTEYTSHHVQVKYGLNTVQEFLNKLSEKITASRTQYNDTLSFTLMSKESAGKYKSEYGNVYQKGALIAACLDVYLLHLSSGTYGLRNLTYDLGVRYGRNRAFEDENLFREIGELSYPEAEAFLRKYVAGSTPIPYDYFFGLAGVQFTPRAERQVISMGGMALTLNPKGQIAISPQSQFNDFGKKLGYKVGDELYAFNGVALNPANLMQVIDSLKTHLKEGDRLTVKIGRATASGTMDTLMLEAAVTPITETVLNKLELMPEPAPQQLLVRKAWLTARSNDDDNAVPEPAPADVASIDGLIKALYEVISGPAGNRNWHRFHSLFLPDARMGAVVSGPGGRAQYHSLTPEGYQRSNAPFFEQSGFYEQELGRSVNQYGNVAMVQSAYQFRFAPNGPVMARGINYITVVKSNGRWWIVQLSWQEESKDNPLPVMQEKQ